MVYLSSAHHPGLGPKQPACGDSVGAPSDNLERVCNLYTSTEDIEAVRTSYSDHESDIVVDIHIAAGVVQE